MKKVFFVTGTARSGSTLLDLMIGNSDEGFSVGELSFLMRPWRPYHLLGKNKCFCKGGNCNFWQQIKNGGERDVYENIFNSKSEVEFIVDSSKDPLWLMDQIRYSREKNYKIVPVLIYKTPLEYFYSIYKRDKNSVVNKGWIRRHQRIFYATKDFVSVSYKELARNPSKKLKSLCSTLDINYFKGKKNFWNNQHSHFLFGSGTVKNSDHHIYYEEQFNAELLRYIKDNFTFDGKYVSNILKVLDRYEIDNKVTDSIKKLKEKYSIYRFPLRLYNRIKSTPFYSWNSNFKG